MAYVEREISVATMCCHLKSIRSQTPHARAAPLIPDHPRLGSLRRTAAATRARHPGASLGVVKSKRTIWRLRTITDFFWAIINLIRAFFATMFSMEKSEAYRKGSGASKKWDGGGPGGPGSGPYGGGPRGPPRGLDNVRGIDHSAAPACGSCCG